jgi:hypothetical protein
MYRIILYGQLTNNIYGYSLKKSLKVFSLQMDSQSVWTAKQELTVEEWGFQTSQFNTKAQKYVVKLKLVMCGLRLGLKPRLGLGFAWLGLHKIVSPAKSQKAGLAGPGSGSSLGFLEQTFLALCRRMGLRGMKY